MGYSNSIFYFSFVVPNESLIKHIAYVTFYTLALYLFTFKLLWLIYRLLLSYFGNGGHQTNPCTAEQVHS